MVQSAHPHQPEAMRSYTEDYEYDAVGNILAMLHGAGVGGWTRRYEYAADSNRLLRTSVPGDAWVSYEHDGNGNMTQMPHLSLMQWDFENQLQATATQVVNGGEPETTYYVYDAAGQRVRKVTEQQNGTRLKERIYLGGFEVYRQYDATGESVTLERETLHGMDGQQRIALVETKTHQTPSEPFAEISTQQPIIRYQLNNHLGSSCIEIDEAGAVISYEEYYPYGNTSYQAGKNVAETSLNRYRYTGKERDEETEFHYYGARYYASWLGRWLSPDPIDFLNSVNLYVYVSNNPVLKIDPNGKQENAPVSESHIDPTEELYEEQTSQESSRNESGSKEARERYYVAFYDQNVSGLEDQAKQWAKDHKGDAFSVAHNKINIILKRISSRNPDKDLVVYFIGHGDSNYREFSTGEGSWLNKEKVLESLQDIPNLRVIAFLGCSVGEKGNLADQIQAELKNVEVFGHVERGTPLVNRTKRSAKRDLTLQDFLIEKIESFKPGHNGNNSPKAIPAKTLISDLLRVDTRKVITFGSEEPLLTKEEGAPKGEKNAVFRDIPAIGFERFWSLISSDESVDISDLNLTKEAELRFMSGIEILRNKFKELLLPYATLPMK